MTPPRACVERFSVAIGVKQVALEFLLRRGTSSFSSPDRWPGLDAGHTDGGECTTDQPETETMELPLVPRCEPMGKAMQLITTKQVRLDGSRHRIRNHEMSAIDGFITGIATIQERVRREGIDCPYGMAALEEALDRCHRDVPDAEYAEHLGMILRCFILAKDSFRAAGAEQIADDVLKVALYSFGGRQPPC